MAFTAEFGKAPAGVIRVHAAESGDEYKTAELAACPPINHDVPV